MSGKQPLVARRQTASGSTLVGAGLRSRDLIDAADQLRGAVDRLRFASPVTHVYNPLRYAWSMHQAFLQRCPADTTRVLFLGMNPGPWGMAQTGVPFGDVAAVRDWLGLDEPIGQPRDPHPKRPIEGLACRRSEVSGSRLWGLFRERFSSAEAFFRDHFVVNYCPLVFMEASARNRTPDKLPVGERTPLVAACDDHLKSVLKSLRPTFAVGIGNYAEACLTRVVAQIGADTRVVRMLHPSPASPAANRGWAKIASEQMARAGIW